MAEKLPRQESPNTPKSIGELLVSKFKGSFAKARTSHNARETEKRRVETIRNRQRAIFRARQAANELKSEADQGKVAAYSFNAWNDRQAIKNMAELTLSRFLVQDTPTTRRINENPLNIERLCSEEEFWKYEKSIYEGQNLVACLYRPQLRPRQYSARLLVIPGHREIPTTGALMLAPIPFETDFKVEAEHLLLVHSPTMDDMVHSW